MRSYAELGTHCRARDVRTGLEHVSVGQCGIEEEARLEKRIKWVVAVVSQYIRKWRLGGVGATAFASMA